MTTNTEPMTPGRAIFEKFSTQIRAKSDWNLLPEKDRNDFEEQGRAAIGASGRGKVEPLLIVVMKFLENHGGADDGSQDLHNRILDYIEPLEADKSGVRP